MTNYEYNIKSFLKALGEPNVEPVDKGWTMCCCPLAPFTHRSGKDSHPSYRDWETDRKSTRLNSSHITRSRMPSSA